MALHTRIVGIIAATAAAAALLAATGTPAAQASPESSNPGTLFAAGAPSEDVGNVVDAGLVVLMRSDASGLPDPSTAAHIFQGASGTAGKVESKDYFGAAVAIGDFNNDNFSDVAIGAPGEDIGASPNTGMVHIMYGSTNGTISGPKAAFHQDSPGVPGGNEPGDFFGREVAVFDYNEDGYDDLAISAPNEDIGTVEDGGAVTILFGSSQGLNNGPTARYIHQALNSIPGDAEPGDQFGKSIAGTDGRLVVGAPLENLGATVDGGAVFVIDFGGQVRGLTQNSPGVSGGAESADFFALDVAAEGNLVFVGAPGEDSGNIPSNGVVHILHVPRSNGAVTDKTISQNSAGISGKAEPIDYFGSGLDARVKGNKIELVVASQFESTGATEDAGMVHLLLVTPSTKAISEVGAWTQASPGVPGASEKPDTFGNAVAFGANGTLVVGVEGEGFGANRPEVGGFFGRNPSGTWRFISQDSNGVPGSAEAGDNFGFSVA